MTTNSPSIDIRTMLLADGVTTPLYIASEPTVVDSASDVITIYDTGGDAPSPKFILDFPTVQVRSRAVTYSDAYQNLLEVLNFLNGRTPETVATTRYTGILATTGILDIGLNENGLFLLVVNFRLYTENATSPYRTALT